MIVMDSILKIRFMCDGALSLSPPREPLHRSIKRMITRRKGGRKRSLHVVNEHSERLCNAVSTASATCAEVP